MVSWLLAMSLVAVGSVKSDPAAISHKIDQSIAARLSEEHVQAAPAPATRNFCAACRSI